MHLSFEEKVPISIGRGGGQDRPLIRNISAVVFGGNNIEYKPIETFRI